MALSTGDIRYIVTTAGGSNPLTKSGKFLEESRGRTFDAWLKAEKAKAWDEGKQAHSTYAEGDESTFYPTNPYEEA